jgi:hypothetical protein
VGTWTAATTVETRPEQVLAVLTDPSSAARWSPVEFDVEELDGERLAPGSRAVLAGRLAGRRIEFRIDVSHSDEGRLALRATGPADMDVEYELAGDCRGTDVVARVDVRPGRGLAGRLLSSATDGLLAAGSLETALGAIAREAEGAVALTYP